MSPTSTKKRLHKATYASDKKKGGYLIRVAGPSAAQFAGEKVPVTTQKGDEHMEQLVKLIWSGADKETGEPVGLYTFQATPREKVAPEF